jgi:hypothetical protein
MKSGRLNLYTLINSAFFIIGVLILIGPAIQNGLPILHSDSGTYLMEGFGNKIPVSRPLSYCLFVRFTSRIFSLWSTVITQAIFVYWMIWLTVNTLIAKRRIAWVPFMTVAMLSATTGIGYYSSQIMPDIFLPIALMGVFVILARTELPRFTFMILCVIIWIALIVHMSNIPVVTVVLLAALFLKVIISRTLKVLFNRNIITLGFILLAGWVTNPFISLCYGEGFKMSNSSSIVFFSRLLQSGAAQKYIKDRCDSDSTYYLCEYKDEIDKYNRLDVFLWTDSSFLYDHPCREKSWDLCWRQRNEEFGKVNSAILDYSPSRKIYIRAVWNDFLLQLRSFGLTTYVSFKAGSHMDYPLKTHYANDYKSYMNSRQYSGTLMFSDMNKIIRITVCVALVLIVFILIRNRKSFSLSSNFLMLLWILIVAWLVNAMLTAMLAVVSERFLGRFIWLVPLMAILLICHEYDRVKKSNEQPVLPKTGED